jgi:hypothetical protein
MHRSHELLQAQVLISYAIRRWQLPDKQPSTSPLHSPHVEGFRVPSPAIAMPLCVPKPLPRIQIHDDATQAKPWEEAAATRRLDSTSTVIRTSGRPVRPVMHGARVVGLRFSLWFLGRRLVASSGYMFFLHQHSDQNLHVQTAKNFLAI